MDLRTCDWAELEQCAYKAIANRDLAALAEVDSALHHRFFGQLDAGDGQSRERFALDVWGVADSEPARSIPEPDPVRRYLTRWEHVAELADAMSQDVTAEEAARELLRAREHGQKLLNVLAKQDGGGIRQGDLAEELGLSRSHLSNLLAEFEELDLVTRRKAGKHVFVSLGLVGRIVAGSRPQAVRATARESWASPMMDRPWSPRWAA